MASMVDHTRRVFEQQVALLRIIGEGGTRDSSHATVVYALRNRGLVTTRGSYGYSSAKITETGRRVLRAAPRQPLVRGRKTGFDQAP